MGLGDLLIKGYKRVYHYGAMEGTTLGSWGSFLNGFTSKIPDSSHIARALRTDTSYLVIYLGHFVVHE